MFHASPSEIARDVGELREAMIGHPMYAALRSISEDTLPVVRRSRPAVEVPCSIAIPASLSIVL